jgi:hypothetical protein
VHNDIRTVEQQLSAISLKSNGKADRKAKLGRFSQSKAELGPVQA